MKHSVFMTTAYGFAVLLISVIILGIIILDASLLLGSVFVLLSSVTRTVRSLPSLQAC